MTHIDLAPLDRGSPVPLYSQLMDDLRKHINSGKYPQGSLLPTEAQIADALKVSRITVKRAVNELARDGLVIRQRGRGTIVTANTQIDVDGGLRTLSQAVARMRHLSKLQNFTRQPLDAPSKGVRECLKLSADDTVESISYVLKLGREGYSHAQIFARQDISQDITDKEIKAKSLFNILLSRQLQIEKADQTITAVIADQALSDALGVTPGAPLLRITILLMDQDNRPLAQIISHMNPEKYQYQMSLSYGV